MNLKNRRVLITAGPTWVRIDSVRVISNIATGRTGILLSKQLGKAGAMVTLLLGPIDSSDLDKGIRLVHFRYFDDLEDTLVKELKRIHYDVVIHSAAVSDYRPKRISATKVSSRLKEWRLNLVPTTKIIDRIKEINRSIFLVGFKFEPQAGKNLLIREARSLISQADLDLAVANTFIKDRYLAYIVGKNTLSGPFKSRESLASGLTDLLNLITYDLYEIHRTNR